MLGCRRTGCHDNASFDLAGLSQNRLPRQCMFGGFDEVLVSRVVTNIFGEIFFTTTCEPAVYSTVGLKQLLTD